MKKGRPFSPEEVLFAPTAQCNLRCAHCFVDRSRGTGKRRLTAEAAVRFLKDCAEHGIERVGFSGGEPFLELPFLASVIKKTVELDMLFDRLMTNGVWWNTEEDCRKALAALCDAGFDGHLGISVDDWHSQDPVKITSFICIAREVFDSDDMFEISAVSDDCGAWPEARLNALAEKLGGRLLLDDGIPCQITVTDSVEIPITAIRYSAPPHDVQAWQSDRWFADDYCEGPGHVLYVHPDGDVAVCCGFANEKKDLIAGTVEDSVESIIASAADNPHIRTCYVEGLASYRKRLEKNGTSFPGKTSDICFFCSWLCDSGLNRK